MNKLPLKTHYQYIHFFKLTDKPKTSVWSCRNNKIGEELGEIKWYSPWRQYCYFPTIQAVYNTGCLKDIIDFLEQLEKDRKQHQESQ